jgi:hypothetical protein
MLPILKEPALPAFFLQTPFPSLIPSLPNINPAKLSPVIIKMPSSDSPWCGNSGRPVVADNDIFHGLNGLLGSLVESSTTRTKDPLPMMPKATSLFGPPKQQDPLPKANPLFGQPKQLDPPPEATSLFGSMTRSPFGPLKQQDPMPTTTQDPVPTTTPLFGLFKQQDPLPKANPLFGQPKQLDPPLEATSLFGSMTRWPFGPPKQQDPIPTTTPLFGSSKQQDPSPSLGQPTLLKPDRTFKQSYYLGIPKPPECFLSTATGLLCTREEDLDGTSSIPIFSSSKQDSPLTDIFGQPLKSFSPVSSFSFGQPRPTLPPSSPLPSTLYQSATFSKSPVFGGVISTPNKLKDSIERSPQVELKGLSSFDSESDFINVGIFGPSCSSKAPWNQAKSDFEPTTDIATFISGDSHASAKETFDLKLKGITDELGSPSKPYFPGRSAREDVIRGKFERLSLLTDLMQIEELLQVLTAGYTDTDIWIEVGGSWMEGIYIASIQRQLEVIGRRWKANHELSNTKEIEDVDGVPRSQAELKALLGSITG